MRAAAGGNRKANQSDPLALFSPYVAEWFRATFGTPTPPQSQGWPAIARGDHALILSPTGSGKTLTAFLWSLNTLFHDLQVSPEPERRPRRGAANPKSGDLRERVIENPQGAAGIRVVYVSPLKALNSDVERNLQIPLAGIRRHARAAGVELPDLRVAVRTGDTPANERQGMLRHPPHVLITTPESLYRALGGEHEVERFGGGDEHDPRIALPHAHRRARAATLRHHPH